jgi:hypothetical protein
MGKHLRVNIIYELLNAHDAQDFYVFPSYVQTVN